MRYPDFTGPEPCTELGPELYQIDHYTPSMLQQLKEACMSCDMLIPCRSWSLHHEGRANGFWAGMTGEERQKERRRLNIVLVDPMVRFHAAS